MASYHVILDNTVPENNRRPSTSKILKHFSNKGITLKYGDIINFSEDRQKYAYIYINDDFLKNSDDSGSGYLSIPLSVSRNFTDAIKHYQKVIKQLGVEFGDIELHVADETIKKKFTTPSHLLEKARFYYLPYDNSLVVEVGNISRPFNITTSQTDIEKAIIVPIVTKKLSIFQRLKQKLKKK